MNFIAIALISLPIMVEGLLVSRKGPFQWIKSLQCYKIYQEARPSAFMHSLYYNVTILDRDRQRYISHLNNEFKKNPNVRDSLNVTKSHFLVQSFCQGLHMNLLTFKNRRLSIIRFSPNDQWKLDSSRQCLIRWRPKKVADGNPPRHALHIFWCSHLIWRCSF